MSDQHNGQSRMHFREDSDGQPGEYSQIIDGIPASWGRIIADDTPHRINLRFPEALERDALRVRIVDDAEKVSETEEFELLHSENLAAIFGKTAISPLASIVRMRNNSLAHFLRVALHAEASQSGGTAMVQFERFANQLRKSGARVNPYLLPRLLTDTLIVEFDQETLNSAETQRKHDSNRHVPAVIAREGRSTGVYLRILNTPVHTVGDGYRLISNRYVPREVSAHCQF